MTKPLSVNGLKLVALAAMVADHCAVVFCLPHGLPAFLLRFFGQCACPLMCCMISEGYRYSKNRRAYCTRLFFCAVLSHLPYNLCFGYGFFQATGVVWAYWLGFLMLAILDREDLGGLGKGILALACCYLARSANWNFVAVLWVGIFGIFRDEPKKLWGLFSLVAVGLLLLPTLLRTGDPFRLYQLGVFLAFPILKLYSGRRGRKTTLSRWGFYVFYPLHLFLLWLVRVP